MIQRRMLSVLTLTLEFMQALATADQIATVPGMAWISTLHGGAIAGFVSQQISVCYICSFTLLNNIKMLPRSMDIYQ